LRLEESFERDPDTRRNKLDALLQESGHATEATESYLKTAVSDNLNTPGWGEWKSWRKLCMGFECVQFDPAGNEILHLIKSVEAIYQRCYLLALSLVIYIFMLKHAIYCRLERTDYKIYKSATTLLTKLSHFCADSQPTCEAFYQFMETTSQHYSTRLNSVTNIMGIPAYNGGLF